MGDPTFEVASQWPWRVIGKQVGAIWGEGRVLAGGHIDVLRDDARNLADLLKARLDQVERHWRIAKRGRLLLGLTHRVVREEPKGASLIDVELTGNNGGQDQVRVRRQLITTRIGVGVHALELLGEIHRRVAFVGIDLCLQQRHGHVFGCWLGVVASSVEHLRHRKLVAQRIRVVHVADSTFGIVRSNVSSDTKVSSLGNHSLHCWVVRREAALRSATRLVTELGPQRWVLGDHPLGELSTRARTVGTHDRRNRFRRKDDAGIVGL